MSQEQAAEAAEQVEEKAAEVDQQFADADAAAAPEPTVEDIASELGWMPKDKFRGPEEKWRPAHEFIREGKNIQERTSRELKEMRQTLENVARTSGAVMADRLAQQHRDLAAQYQRAVDQGDPDTAFAAANAIRDLQQRATMSTQAQPATPAQETVSWVDRNARVKADPVAWQRALQICDAYARTYPQSSPAEQLAYTEQNLKREYPHLFDDKGPPNVNGNVARTSGVSSKGKTAADLPKEARAIAQDWVDRGLLPNLDAYAKNYFAEVEKRKAQ